MIEDYVFIERFVVRASALFSSLSAEALTTNPRSGFCTGADYWKKQML